MRQNFKQKVSSWIYYLMRDQSESGIKVEDHYCDSEFVIVTHRNKKYRIEIKEIK